MSSIYKCNGYFYYQYSEIDTNGRRKRKQKSLGTKDKREAEYFKQQYDIQFANPLRNPFKKNSLPISKSVEIYIDDRQKEVNRGLRSENTLRTDKVVLNLFSSYTIDTFGDVNIDEISKRMIMSFKEKRLDEVCPSTISNNLRHIKSFFSKIKYDGKIEIHPMDDIKIPQSAKRLNIPKEKDWDKLYEYLKSYKNDFIKGNAEYDFFKVMIWIQMNLGLRIGEVSSIKWQKDKEDKGTGHSRSYVFLSNSNKELTIYFKRRLRVIPTDIINDVIKTIPKQQTIFRWTKNRRTIDNKYVFENPNTNGPFQINSIARMFKKLMREVCISDDYTSHSLRHGWCSHLLRKGADIYKVSQLMGHSVVQVTEIYSHLIPKDFKGVLSMVDT